MVACSAVFSAWDDSLKEFTNVAREVTRKRSEKFLPIKINPAHAALQERVTYLRGFRKQHHELQVMVGPLGTDTKRIGDGREVERVSVLNDIDMDAEVSSCLIDEEEEHEYLILCYSFAGPSSLRIGQECRRSRCLYRFVHSFIPRHFVKCSSSPCFDAEGTEIWITAETSYNERVSRVEHQIISRLRSRLDNARTSNEKFRVFSKFNALFVRPKIRGE